MSWYVYSMWVFRVEKLPLKLDKNGERVQPPPRFIDVEFSKDYKLSRWEQVSGATNPTPSGDGTVASA